MINGAAGRARIGERAEARATWPRHGDEGAALCAISRVARYVDRGHAVPEADDAELDLAASYFDGPGTWAWASDAAMVRALERGLECGRKLQPIDHGRLREIIDRAHRALDRLDRRHPI